MDRTKSLKLVLVVAAAFGLGAGTMWGVMRDSEPPKHEIPPALVVAADPADGGAGAAKPTSKRPDPQPVVDTPAKPRLPKPSRPAPPDVPRRNPGRDGEGKPGTPKNPPPRPAG